MLTSLIYLRLLAILLIVNSHMWMLHPTPSLAFGGHLGNSLFYFLSGFGLATSYQRNPLPYAQWTRRRILKVAIPIVLFVFIAHAAHPATVKADLVKYLVWHDWSQLEEFIPVLLGLYCLFLPLAQLSRSGRWILWGALLGVATVGLLARASQSGVVPRHLPSSSIFFLFNATLCFILGMQHSNVDVATSRYGTLKWAALSMVGILAHLVFSRRGGSWVVANFPLNLALTVALYRLACSGLREGRGTGGGVVSAMAASSLAVYILHGPIMRLGVWALVPYPLNVVVIIVVVFAISHVLHTRASKITGLIVDGRPVQVPAKRS